MAVEQVKRVATSTIAVLKRDMMGAGSAANFLVERVWANMVQRLD